MLHNWMCVFSIEKNMDSADKISRSALSCISPLIGLSECIAQDCQIRIELYKYPDIRKSEYPETRISRYPEIRISAEPDIQIFANPNTRKPEYPNIRKSDFSKTWISRYAEIRISENSDIQIFENPHIVTGPDAYRMVHSSAINLKAKPEQQVVKFTMKFTMNFTMKVYNKSLQ